MSIDKDDFVTLDKKIEETSRKLRSLENTTHGVITRSDVMKNNEIVHNDSNVIDDVDYDSDSFAKRVEDKILELKENGYVHNITIIDWSPKWVKTSDGYTLKIPLGTIKFAFVITCIIAFMNLLAGTFFHWNDPSISSLDRSLITTLMLSMFLIMFAASIDYIAFDNEYHHILTIKTDDTNIRQEYNNYTKKHIQQLLSNKEINEDDRRDFYNFLNKYNDLDTVIEETKYIQDIKNQDERKKEKEEARITQIENSFGVTKAKYATSIADNVDEDAFSIIEEFLEKDNILVSQNSMNVLQKIISMKSIDSIVNDSAKDYATVVSKVVEHIDLLSESELINKDKIYDNFNELLIIVDTVLDNILDNVTNNLNAASDLSLEFLKEKFGNI